jgi:hypothetical protein
MMMRSITAFKYYNPERKSQLLQIFSLVQSFIKQYIWMACVSKHDKKIHNNYTLKYDKILIVPLCIIQNYLWLYDMYSCCVLYIAICGICCVLYKTMYSFCIIHSCIIHNKYHKWLCIIHNKYYTWFCTIHNK